MLELRCSLFTDWLQTEKKNFVPIFIACMLLYFTTRGLLFSLPSSGKFMKQVGISAILQKWRSFELIFQKHINTPQILHKSLHSQPYNSKEVEERETFTMAFGQP